jgi:predicted amidophosphoribosyltransferase
MLDLLLPQRCVVCGCGGRQLCAGCHDELRRLAFASARAAVGYDAAARRLVHAWKERGLRRLAAETAQLVAERLPAPEVDALTFVPADRGRRLERGHNPAERLALELTTLWQLPCLPLLERTRGGRQRGSSAVERRTVRGAFRATGPAPRKVAVIDDVYTTGATAAAAASALRAGGARRVEAVAFARALRRG